MKITRQQFSFSRKLLVLSLLAAFGPAYAADEVDDVTARLINPESTVSAGIGAFSGSGNDRAIFSQFNGLRKNDTNLLLDFNYVTLDKVTGFWTTFEGRNLALDNRELRFSQIKQGDWKYSAEYNEITRHDFRTINTGLQGAGTTTPTVTSLSTPGTGTDLNLELQRKAVTLGAEKWLTSNLMFDAAFKNEKKEGARLSGLGLFCSDFPLLSRFPCSAPTGALLMLPEPINSTIRQIDTKLNYSDDNILLSGGYYGSFYTNENGSMNPAMSGNLYNPNGTVLDTTTTPGSTLAGFLQQSVALSPDNQAHQLYVAGSLTFSPTTHANFKYSRSRATQDEDFANMGLTGAPAGVGSLGGRVDSTLSQFAVTSKPMQELSMLASLRYENKQDKTPLDNYVKDNAGNVYTNDLNNSNKKATGKLEASYRLPDNYRATLGMDYAVVHRDLPVATADTPDLALALSGLRENIRELGYRAELKRSLSEALNGSIGYGHSHRDGGNWTVYNAAGSAFPMTMTNCDRDKLKLTAGWTPNDTMSFQFMIESGKDTFDAPSGKGLRDNGMQSFSVDASYNLAWNWTLTGYLNQGSQTQHVDHSVGYQAELENTNTTFGLGISGKPSDQFEVGGDLSYLNDSNSYKLDMSSGAPLLGGGLPDITYRATTLKLFGKYALEKNADVRVDLMTQSSKFEEWTWGYNGTPFAYSDNTTVTMKQNQNVTFLGAKYIYKFR